MLTSFPHTQAHLNTLRFVLSTDARPTICSLPKTWPTDSRFLPFLPSVFLGVTGMIGQGDSEPFAGVAVTESLGVLVELFLNGEAAAADRGGWVDEVWVVICGGLAIHSNTILYMCFPTRQSRFNFDQVSALTTPFGRIKKSD